MDGSSFTGNSATGNGGAVSNNLGITGNAPYAGSVVLSMQNTTFDSNTSGALGGAIYKYTSVGGAALTAGIQGTFTNNSAVSGGAIYNSTANYSGTGIASIVHLGDGSTFTGNTASSKGGAIYNDNQGYINMESDALGISFSGNSAGGGNSAGQDIYMANTKATVNFNVNGAGDIDIEDGIAGIGGTLTMQGVTPGAGGVLNLNGSNEFYVGTFIQNSGQTEVGGSFFGGTSTLAGGLLEFNDGSAFAKTGTLTLSGGTTNINNSGDMTLGDGQSIGTQLKGTAALNKTTSGTGTLNLISDESGYSGLFTQDAGNTVVSGAGIMFSGQNNIDNTNGLGSVLSVTSGQSSIYYNVNLTDGGVLNHYCANTTGSGITSINAAANPMPNQAVSGKGVNFVGSGSTATFDSGLAGGTPAYYALTQKLDNGLANNVNFSNSIVYFTSTATTAGSPWYTGTQFFDGSLSPNPSVNPSIDYTGATTYGFTNSTLDFANSNTNYQNYYFSNLISDTTNFMTLKVAPENDTEAVSISNPLIADTLTVANAASSVIGVNRVYIYDSTTSPLDGRVQILYGDSVTFDANVVSSQYSATTIYAYKITAVDADGGTTGDIQWLDFDLQDSTPGAITLNDVNMNDSLVNATGSRSYQIGSSGYTVDGSLGVMNVDSVDITGDSTTFSVFGQSTNAADNVLDADGNSLFNMTSSSNGTTGSANFTLADLTVQNADTASSGSVLNLSDSAGTAVISNVTAQNNTSSDAGGAVYQSDGTVTVVNSRFNTNTSTTGFGGAIDQTGGTMNVINSNFTGNNAAASYGGAIATNTAVMDISGGTFTDNTAANGGAIYNSSSDLAINGGTTFVNNSASADGGAIYNAGTLNLNTDSGDITFSGNTAGGDGGDIYNTSTGIINLSGTGGTVVVADGISGSGAINNTGGNLLLASGSDSTGFTGTFTQTSGTTSMIGSSFGGDMDIEGGTLNWGNTTPHLPERSLQVSDGAALNILNGGYLEMNSPDDIISSGANINIAQGGTLDITNNNNITLNSTDYWGGAVLLNGTGFLTLDGMTNDQITGIYTQTSGTLNVTNGSDLYLGSPSSITGGNISVDNSVVHTVGGMTINLDSGGGNLTLNNAVVDTTDSYITNNTFAGALSATGADDFMIDVNGANQTSDTFTFAGAITGDINISNYNFITAPTASHFDIQVFNSPDMSGAVFTTNAAPVRSPIGVYTMVSEGDGLFGFDMTGFNPQVFRGQAATLAMYNSQLAVDKLLLDHVYLDSNELIGRGLRNRYAASTAIFGPYQFSQNEGGLWFKNYANFERLSMTQGINVSNDLYGSIVGADFAPVNLKNGWKLLPTAYISYNGGRQGFDGVSMFQNGGQGGFMGTFTRGDFIGTVLAYAGGYNNEMSVGGFTDRTGNWFAGTALKSAYNFHPTRSLILQPTLLATYNIFGNQNWGSDFGALSMNAGFLNAINVAPGLNVIYGKEDWSVYLTTMYMYNINDKLNGSAGGMELPNLRMRHGYFEYGIGGTKTWKERLMGWAQVSVRNGGRTGIALQFGLTWKF
jgi:predicted outer membrane repeat protein